LSEPSKSLGSLGSTPRLLLLLPPLSFISFSLFSSSSSCSVLRSSAVSPCLGPKNDHCLGVAVPRMYPAIGDRAGNEDREFCLLTELAEDFTEDPLAALAAEFLLLAWLSAEDTAEDPLAAEFLLLARLCAEFSLPASRRLPPPSTISCCCMRSSSRMSVKSGRSQGASAQHRRMSTAVAASRPFFMGGRSFL